MHADQVKKMLEQVAIVRELSGEKAGPTGEKKKVPAESPAWCLIAVDLADSLSDLIADRFAEEPILRDRKEQDFEALLRVAELAPDYLVWAKSTTDLDDDTPMDLRTNEAARNLYTLAKYEIPNLIHLLREARRDLKKEK